MAVNDNPRRAGPFAGNGVTTSFPFEFKLLDADDIEVRVTTMATTTILTRGVDYEVTGVGADAGGSVVLGNALPTGSTLNIIGSAAFSQPLVLANQGPFFAEAIMQALDRNVVLSQQLDERVQRALLAPPGSTPEEASEIIETVLGAADDAALAAGMAAFHAGQAAARAAQANGMPSGALAVWGDPIPPTGWLSADGATLLRNDFPHLYAAIGAKFGSDAAPTQHLVNPDFTSDLDGWAFSPTWVWDVGKATFTSGAGDAATVFEQAIDQADWVANSIVEIDVAAITLGAGWIGFPGAFRLSMVYTPVGGGSWSGVVTIGDLRQVPGVQRAVLPEPPLQQSGSQPRVRLNAVASNLSLNSFRLQRGGNFSLPDPFAPFTNAEYIIKT